MGEHTLIVSNIHKQLSCEHLRKIFSAAVNEIPKRIEVVGREEEEEKEEEWYVAQVTFGSAHVARQAKELLHGKTVLDRDLFIDHESREVAELVQKEFNDTNNRINKLNLSIEYLKQQREAELAKHKHVKEVTDELHELQVAKLTRDLDQERAKGARSETEIAKLQMEIASTKELNVDLRRAKQLNADAYLRREGERRGERYNAMRSKLEVTLDGLKVLKQSVQSYIPYQKTHENNGTHKRHQEVKYSSYEAIVSIHNKIIEIIDKAERQDTSSKN